MTLLPVVVRELIAAGRRKETYYQRLMAPLVALLVLLWIFLLSAAQVGFTQQGQFLFQILSGISFAYCLLAGAATTADCLSSEKREGTLGLLFLTPLRGHDVVLGKFTARSLASCYSQISIIPFLSIALLLGGITQSEVGLMILVLANTLFLSLSAGVLVSCISRHPRHAMFATGFLMLGIAFGPYLVAEWHTYGMNSNVFDGLDSRFLVPSPFFTFNFVENPWGKKFSAGDFYPSLAFDHLLGWLFLVLASVWLPHISKDRPKSRLGLAWEKFQNVWAYGARASREVRRRRLLDSSPLHWLAGRHSRRRVYPWLFLLGLGAVWGWIYRYYEDLALDWPTTVGFCFIVQAAFKIWYGSEVCQRLGEDRRSGAIELLLSTPLKVVDFARGQAQALRSVFLWPLLCLILIEIILIRIGSQRFTHNYDAGEIWRLMILSNVVLVADLMTLKWTGLWEALLGGSPNRTILKTIFRVLALPWIVIVTVMATLSVSAAAFGFYIEADRVVQGLWIGLSLANDAWWYFRGRHRFLAHFRVIASEGWNTARRAPPRGPAIPEKTSSTLAAKDAFTFREWSRNHRALASLGFLLAASFLAIISCQFWTRHKLQKYIAGMVAGGQPANHAGLMSSMPRYRPGEDAAPLLKQAMTSSKFQAANFNLWTLNNVHREISAETYERARVMVRYNREALTSAQEALAMPDCGSMLDWSPGPSRPGMGLWALQGVGQLVFWQAALDLQDGNADAAVRAISSLLQLARFAGQQPAIEALNARLSILDRAADLLELLLARQPLPAPTLAELDRRLSRVHDPASVERAIRGETAFLVEHCNDSTALANRFMGTMNSQEQTLLLLFHYAGGVTGLRERDLLDLLRRVDTGLGVFKLNYPERARRAADLAADGSLTGPHRFNFFIWYQDLPMAIPGLVRREAVVLGRLNAARMALAVEQFRESEGRLPQTNAELSGRQSTARLTDPLTGEPLAFQRLENGYRTGTKEQLKQPGKTRGRSAGAQGVEFTVPR